MLAPRLVMLTDCAEVRGFPTLITGAGLDVGSRRVLEGVACITKWVADPERPGGRDWGSTEPMPFDFTPRSDAEARRPGRGFTDATTLEDVRKIMATVATERDWDQV